MPSAFLTPRSIIMSLVVLAATFGMWSLTLGQSTTNTKDVDRFRMEALSRATLLYMFEHDDAYPPLYQNYKVCLPGAPTQCGFKNMWQFDLVPYLGSMFNFYAPEEPPNLNAARNHLDLSYGYNYVYMSTLCIAHDAYSQTHLGCPDHDSGDPQAANFFQPVYYSSFEKHGQAIVLTDFGGRDYINPQTLGSAVSAPDTWRSDKYGFSQVVGSGWGKDCNNTFSFSKGQVLTGRWADTDGFAPRYGNKAHVAFDDGHVALLSIGEAAAGTNWTSTLPCGTLQVLDRRSYLWDPRF